MSTSDQQDRSPLTRKQLRELRLTGSTPVITAEEPKVAPPAPPLPRAAEPIDVAPAPADDRDVDLGAAPLTRRQAREQERIKTASVPVLGGDDAADSTASDEAPLDEVPVEEAPVEEAPVDEAPVEEMPAEEATEQAAPEIVSAIPTFGASADHDVDDVDDVDDEQADVVPVSAAASAHLVGDVPLTADDADAPHGEDTGDHADAAEAVAALGIDVADDEGTDDEGADDDLLADVHGADAHDDGERPTVSAAFGSGLLADADEAAPQAAAPSFDELLGSGDSAGSHHTASTLIFNPPPGEGSLSGPVASTGEILVTGSYELPQGIGSQGHAHGTADGKEVDAVLIDGELPPASSPTPIAASSAISTIKPAGEVIRPPAPEKGNKLMLTLAIVAGGLALALGVVLVIAFTTNVL